MNEVQILENDSLEKKLGEVVKRLRNDSNMSIEELARKSNITHTTLRKLERGLGSRLSTFVNVLKVLKREDLILNIVNSATRISPVEILNQKKKSNEF